MKKFLSYIFVILTIIIVPIQAHAYTLSNVTTTAQRNAIAINWIYKERGYADYNCLSWALGNTTSWTWPWGSKNPTVSEVNIYMLSKGYRNVGKAQKSSDIYAFGPSSEVTHFGRGVNSFSYVMSAKWGSCELFNHTNTNPYQPKGVYGIQITSYKK